MPMMPMSNIYTVQSYSNFYNTPFLHISSYSKSDTIVTLPLSMLRIPTFFVPTPRPPNTINTLVSSKNTAPPCTHAKGRMLAHRLNLLCERVTFLIKSCWCSESKSTSKILSLVFMSLSESMISYEYSSFNPPKMHNLCLSGVNASANELFATFNFRCVVVKWLNSL